MSEDEGQEGKAQRPAPSRPVTAAARRERRASARKAAEGKTEQTSTESTSAGPTGKRRPPTKAAGKPGTSESSASKGTTEKKGKPTPARDGKAERRPPLYARLVRFLREVVAELRKVIWPTRKQMITYTSVVLVFLAVMTAFVFGLDYVFAAGVFWVFG